MAFDIDNIRLLLAAVDRGSFSAAARALNRVPSAVSMAIGNLEAELGVQLFDRGGREPKPTAAALALLPQARLLVEQLHRLDMHARALTQGLETSLALAIVPELAAAAPWSEALRQLAGEYPLLQVEVLTAPQQDALAMAQSGRVQLALVFERYGMTAEESFQEIGEETLVAVVAPHHPMLSGAGAAGIRDEDLQSQRQIVVAGRDVPHVDKRFAISAIQWRTDSPSAALSLVAAGLGWAWLPSGFVRDAVAGGSLVQLPLQNLTNVLRLYVDVVWASGRPLGVAARRFVELLNAHRAGLA
jgi:DNA-binding transcriptional LysR family regulator